MSKLLVLALCVAFTAAAVRRDAPPAAAPGAGPALADLEKHAAEFGKVFNERITAIVNSKETQEVQKALKDGSESVLQQLTAFSNSLQGAIADATGKAKEALESSRANIQKATEDLRAAHPEVEQQAAALRERISGAVKTVADETQRLSQNAAKEMDQANQKLAPKIREAYDDFVKHAQQLQENIHKAANKQ